MVDLIFTRESPRGIELLVVLRNVFSKGRNTMEKNYFGLNRVEFSTFVPFALGNSLVIWYNEARGQRPEARGQRPEARGQRPDTTIL
jgi:hypothetical protein